MAAADLRNADLLATRQRTLEAQGLLRQAGFRVLEALLHKGPLPVNTIGPKVHLTPGSISVAVDRLLEKGASEPGGKPR